MNKARKTKKQKIRKGEYSGEGLFNYHTRVEVLEKKYGTKLNVPPDTKLGDFFKSKKEGEPFLKLLRS